ncbi:MAG: protoheme IX farnesyltransferase [Planctomycetes bacterium]|nr:protoheme IX farnesyltransferase [Planctomycetota bacterium]
MKKLKTLAELIKFRIVLLAALTTAAGYAAGSGPDLGIIWPVLGVFLLAGGAAAFNQYQDRNIDGLMERTRLRPIPSGRFGASEALAVAFVFITAGLAVLFLRTTIVAFVLGMVALIWYNGVYAYLKRKTAFAVVPGALTGAIAPLIGWTGAGYSLSEPQAAGLAFFFFLWQIPHFWLLSLIYGKDYQKAGLPSITVIFNARQLKRIASVWMLASAVSCMLLPLYAPEILLACRILFFAMTLVLSAGAVRMLLSENAESYAKTAFAFLNVCVLLTVLILAFTGFNAR